MKLQGQIRKVATVHKPPKDDNPGEGDLITTLSIELEDLGAEQIAWIHRHQRQEVILDLAPLQMELELKVEASR